MVGHSEWNTRITGDFISHNLRVVIIVMTLSLV